MMNQREVDLERRIRELEEKVFGQHKGKTELPGRSYEGRREDRRTQTQRTKP